MALSNLDWIPVVLSILALAGGGVLKGATGAGVPILAVPVIALYYDIRTAVIVMLLPSLFANVLQSWQYRAHLSQAGFAGRLALAGILGAMLGTVLLANVPPGTLLFIVAILVLVFVVFRVARPSWHLPPAAARIMSVPAGLAAGVLQGATGVSAPISLTFLNACGLPRSVFVSVVSLFFLTSTAMQFAGLAAYRMLTLQGLMLSAGALLLILAMMPVGEALGRRFSAVFFDRMILALLTVIALRILIFPG